jgi:MraZ protein
LKRAPFFPGSYDLILDAKNRLSIPAQVRKNFDAADEGTLFVTMKESILRLYTMGHFRRTFKKETASGLMPSELQKNYTYLRLSLGAEVECDAQGRVVLPDSILKLAGLGKEGPREVTLVGVQDHLQIFARETWTALREKVIAQREMIDAVAKEVLQRAYQGNRTTPPATAT